MAQFRNLNPLFVSNQIIMLPRRALGAFARLPSALRTAPTPFRSLPALSSRTFTSTRSQRLATVADLDAIDSVVVAPSAEMMGFEVTQSASKTEGEIDARPIYLDMQATTPTDPRVLDAMLPFMTNQYGNPHSKTHAYGWETESAVEEGRKVSLCVLLLLGSLLIRYNVL